MVLKHDSVRQAEGKLVPFQVGWADQVIFVYNFPELGEPPNLVNMLYIVS